MSLALKDIANLSREIDLENLEKIQSRIHERMQDILKAGVSERIKFEEKIDAEKVTIWLDGLEKLVKDYKWSKYINVTTLFQNIGSFRYYEHVSNIPYRAVLELFKIYKSLGKEDKEPFKKTIANELNKNYSEEPEDDLPF